MTIAETLKQLASQNRKALAPFSTIGDPDMDTSLEIFRHFGEWGADLVELGIPYSDPLMDGPTLQRSYIRALDKGFKLARLAGFVEKIKQRSDTPLLIMTCVNPILQYGVEKFFRDVSSAGVDSLLITDLPPEEWGEKMDLARGCGLGTIFLVTQTTPPERLKLLDELSDPFVYCVSKMGITGAGDELPPELEKYMASLREALTRPMLIGFGISTPAHARAASGLADGVVIGSAVVKHIEAALAGGDCVRDIGDFISSVRTAMDD